MLRRLRQLRPQRLGPQAGVSGMCLRTGKSSSTKTARRTLRSSPSCEGCALLLCQEPLLSKKAEDFLPYRRFFIESKLYYQKFP